MWPGRFYAGPQDGENPYAGFLAYADRVVVTPDSVNMLSEACATGKPVSSYVRYPLHGKLALFHQALEDTGLLQPLGQSLDPNVAPLREAAKVAAAIGARYRK
jgi:mitochondrial fission protein ELM1